MSLLMDKPEIGKSRTLLVPLKSYLYLQEKSHRERTGKPCSEKIRERLARNFGWFSVNGLIQVMDSSLGGHAAWSVGDMARILDNAGLPWQRGEDVECIAV